jgi:hypothetical protein
VHVLSHVCAATRAGHDVVGDERVVVAAAATAQPARRLFGESVQCGLAVLSASGW